MVHENPTEAARMVRATEADTEELETFINNQGDEGWQVEVTNGDAEEPEISVADIGERQVIEVFPHNDSVTIEIILVEETELFVHVERETILQTKEEWIYSDLSEHQREMENLSEELDITPGDGYLLVSENPELLSGSEVWVNDDTGFIIGRRSVDNVEQIDRDYSPGNNFNETDMESLFFIVEYDRETYQPTSGHFSHEFANGREWNIQVDYSMSVDVSVELPDIDDEVEELPPEEIVGVVEEMGKE